jgi:transposase-like protein
MGRRSKLTPEVQKRVCDALVAGGAYIETAAAFAGIARSTLYNWLKQGRADAEKGKENKYTAFVEAIDEALSRSEMNDLATISHHADGYLAEKKRVVRVPVGKDDEGNPLYRVEETTEQAFKRDWQAAAWRLERRYPTRWGRRLALAGNDGAPIAGRVSIELPDNGRRNGDAREDRAD